MTLLSYGINELPKGNIGNKNYGFFLSANFVIRLQNYSYTIFNIIFFGSFKIIIFP